MGMISRFIDKLRDTAIRVEIFLEGSTDTIPTDTHEQLRNAADIIWELRNDLQRANNAVQNAEHDESMAWDRVRKAEAENAKLRNEVDNLLDFEHLTSIAVAYAGCDECGEYKQTMLRLFAENAKLRELLKNALTYIEYEGCGVECPETGNSATLTPCDTCNHYETESCAYVIEQDARELGIEVNDD